MRIDNLEWNYWNLDLSRSYMKGILRSMCILSLETNQGASKIEGRTFDRNFCILTLISRKSVQVEESNSC